MSISAMYAGASGVTAYSTKLGVIGNNLANVNTTAFRGSEVLFQDLFSQYRTVGQVLSDDTGAAFQVGTGVSVSDIRVCLTQGSILAASTNTDLAIDGKGMFRVVDPDNSTSYYTRAGNFRFDNDGYLVDPNGNVLQGREINAATGALGSTTNIQLPWEQVVINGQTTMAVVSPATPTQRMNFQYNLDRDESDHSTDAQDPFFALAKLWDGTSDTPLAADSYAYSSSITVYDSAGNSHVLNSYFDKVESDDGTGNVYWEYVVGMDPDEDGGALTGTSGAGLLLIGTLTFDRNGMLVGQSAYSYTAGGTEFLSNWTPATFSADGLPQLSATFLASAAGGAAGGAQNIALNFGVSSATGAWDNLGSNASSAASVGLMASGLPDLASLERDAEATTGYAGSLATLSQNQDGYATGYMVDAEVTTEGFLRASFTNGQEQDLYQIPLYVFTNEYGLRSEGNNLYTATSESGAAIEGLPETGARGSILGASLEGSNVDMAEEMVDMILTQRALQANTKVISTADSMINTAISMKR
ncbi:MAG TPA: flagellar hook-basal body protein [Desulfovibrio sp.]|nr:flagellar hook-basal body protein [Desulfovibrio sp.]HBR06258.1 flagellar hook-basal body protein [Desulfovibrio sp.]